MENPESQVERDAKAWLAVRLGDRPFVPDPARSSGDATQIVKASIERAATLRRQAPASSRGAPC
jgi:hypothetical protein